MRYFFLCWMVISAFGCSKASNHDGAQVEYIETDEPYFYDGYYYEDEHYSHHDEGHDEGGHGGGHGGHGR